MLYRRSPQYSQESSLGYVPVQGNAEAMIKWSCMIGASFNFSAQICTAMVWLELSSQEEVLAQVA